MKKILLLAGLLSLTGCFSSNPCSNPIEGKNYEEGRAKEYAAMVTSSYERQLKENPIGDKKYFKMVAEQNADSFMFYSEKADERTYCPSNFK